MGQPLPINDPGFRARHLTVVLYWKKRHGIDALQNGHAALIIDTALLDLVKEDYYVSWLSSGPKLVNRAVQGSFFSDAEEWGGTPVPNGNMHIPNRWVALKGLNIAGMKEEWDRIRGKQRAHWKLFDKNCATVVARVLKAGDADDFATRHKHQNMWWPTDLLRYARSMGQNVFMES